MVNPAQKGEKNKVTASLAQIKPSSRMSTLSTFRYIIVFFYLCFYFRISLSEEQKYLSFDFENFGKDSNFGSELALYGDAKVVNGGIQMSGSMGFSSGRILNKQIH